ncbi:MAG: hypothetical protein M2R45_02230 [Verrucomicrobia subdivision 3 bacterium]|nr:hypothetical protein [Limisphaerales bacterium]MCS1413985.1 hypothetical protein [Limisphaerales bacterium]
MQNRNQKHLLTILTALSIASSVALASELTPAFNGHNFNGWKVPENNIWWTAKSGIMKLQSGTNKKGSTLWTKKEYGNLIMEFDFKMGHGTVDTGIYVRTKREQIQIGISGSLKRDMTGSPYISGKGYPVEARNVKEILKPKDWNHMTIVAIGKNYSVWLNGHHIMSYDSDSAVEKGPLGIQLHGNRDMSAEYKNITISELD